MGYTLPMDAEAMENTASGAAGDRAPEAVGGKAEGLMALDAVGARVPPWVVLSAEDALHRARSDDAGAPYFEALWETLAQAPFQGLAVRSSATDEDGAARSRAGAYATRFVDHPAALPAAFEAVAASLDDDAARRGVRMAIVVQAAVPARVSGVAFSACPAAADPEVAYVEAVSGAGERLVGGHATPSRFHLARENGRIVDAAPSPDGPDDLPEALRRPLLATMQQLEDRLDAPVDLEWVHDGETLYWVQARPMTALHPATFPDICMTSWFFDQRFTEPVSTFSRSTLLPLIADVALGDALRMRNVPVEAPLLHYHGGQAYVAHRVWRAMLAGAPRWWLSDDLRALFPERCACPKAARRWRWPFGYAWAALCAVLRERREVFGNLQAWDRYAEGLAGRLAAVDARAEDTAEDWQAKWAAFDAESRAFLRIHRWSILWADYAFRLFRRCGRMLPEGARQRRERRLLAGVDLATVRANAALARYLADGTPGTDLPEVYGTRSGSLDYAVPTWAELAASGELANQYRGLPRQGAAFDDAAPPLRGFRRILGRLLELREEQRLVWERVLAAQRAMALRLGDALADAGQIPDRDAVWDWPLETLLDLRFGGGSPPPGLAAARRHRRRLDRITPTPAFIGPDTVEAHRDDPSLLRGIGASSGRAEGVAQVLRHPGDFRPGTGPVIIVTAALDPAWSPLLARCAGAVVERGGMLSHAAVIAREYGTPLVIGIDNATDRIPHGTLLHLDGTRGTVHIPPPITSY